MKRALLLVAVVLVALVVLGAGSLYTALRASLPDLGGEAALPGLSAAVTVERDAAGIPTITAATRADASRALGYVHAQERFFQMDLLRRAASGELSALLGEATWRTDSTLRPHRLRARALAVVDALPAGQRAALDAYVDGVNAGLDALGARPFEYLALRQAPAPWRPEDSILAAYAMYLDLQFDGGYGLELERDALYAALPDALADFLTPTGDDWDAALAGDTVAPPAVPTAEDLGDWRPGDEAPAEPEADVVGSNNWAVAGDLTETGAALVADDMHLGLQLPHIWFRASLVVDGRRTTGATLPGAPLMVVGSNGDVAWGFTNSYGDYIDYVRLEMAGPGLVRTDSGTVAIDTLREEIAVGDEVRVVEVLETPWGPVTATGPDGALYAMQWGAHRPEATNLALLDVETATTLDAALDAANRAGIPAQNFVAGDRAGRIGWTIAGQIPRREGRDGRRPVASTDPNARWAGFLSPDEVPRVVDPADGRIWTANSRVASGDALALIGDGNYAHGARARQIRDALRALAPPISERDLLGVQLDDRALFYARWRALLLDATADDPAFADLRAVVEAGSGTSDDAAYRVVRDFRSAVVDRVLPPLLAPARALAPRAGYPARDETPVWALVTERPAHLLPPGHDSWDALVLDAARAVDDLDTAWPEANALSMTHPMADALPGIGDRLRMPTLTQRGDSRMPRVAGRGFGASQRMVVSPGFEERGIFHMPGGQAGHFLSPYWGAGHDDWAEGRPSPFLPGETAYTLTLTPAD